MGNSFTTTPATPATTAEGYYVKRAKVIATAGTDNFNISFNLDNNAVIADEDIVQAVFDQGDRFVDQRAFIIGLTAESGATLPHFIATTNTVFNWLGDWASRWARAQGYLLRGVTGSEDGAGAKAEGQMRDMRDEAEGKIDELLRIAYGAQAADVGSYGAKLYHACHPCSPIYPWGGW